MCQYPTEWGPYSFPVPGGRPEAPVRSGNRGEGGLGDESGGGPDWSPGSLLDSPTADLCGLPGDPTTGTLQDEEGVGRLPGSDPSTFSVSPVLPFYFVLHNRDDRRWRGEWEMREVGGRGGCCSVGVIQVSEVSLFPRPTPHPWDR